LTVAMRNLINNHPDSREVRICDASGDTIALYDARGNSAMR